MQLDLATSRQIRGVAGTTSVSTLSSLLYGYFTAGISGAVDAIDLNLIAPLGLQDLAARLMLGVTVSSLLIGTIIGSLVAGYTAERMGRRRSMILTSALFFVCAWGSAFPETGLASAREDSWTLVAFICYRLVGGVAVGFAFLGTSQYVTEFAPGAVRGHLASYRHIAIVGGICVALLVNWGIGLQGDDAWVLETGWRFMLLSPMVPAFAFLWLSFSVPESASWLARQTCAREARPPIETAAPAPAPLLAFGARVVIIGVLLGALQQLLGVNAISYYGPQILLSMGYHPDGALLGMLVARTIDLLASLAAARLVDRTGRRPLLIAGALVMAASMMWIGAQYQAGTVGPAAFIAMCGYLLGFGLSFGPVVWIALSEMFPAQIRAQAMTACLAAQWSSNLLVSVSFPLMFGDPADSGYSHGGLAFWIYGSLALLAVFIALRYVPETRGIDNAALGTFWRRQTRARLKEA